MPYSLACLRHESPERQVDIEGLFEPTPEGWQNLALSIASLEGDLDLTLIGRGAYDSFLDRQELTKMLAGCRLHTWGSRLNVAISTSEPDQASPFDEPSTTRKWARHALSLGVQDLLELPERFGEPEWLDGSHIRTGLDRLAENRERANGMLSPELRGATLWKTRAQSIRLNRLLDKPIRPRQETEEADSLVFLVIDSTDQLELVSRHLKERPEGPVGIATLGFAEKPALTELRRTHGIPRPLDFRSELELFFFSEWLAKVEQQPQSQPSETRLVITNSFSPETDPKLTIAAAADVGKVLSDLPNAKYRIERRGTQSRMASCFAALDGRAVWLHLGHGMGENGLQDLHGEAVGADLLIDTIVSSETDLRAAIFLSCDSVAVAKSLKLHSGVDFSFGFSGQLGPDDGRHFARILLPTLLDGAEKIAVREAFRKANRSLRAAGSAATATSFPDLNN